MPEACGNRSSPLGGNEIFCGNCGYAVNGSRPQSATATVISGQARARAAAPPARAPAEGTAEGAAEALTSYIRAADRQMSYRDLGLAQTLDPLSNTRFYSKLARRFALYFVVVVAVDTVIFVFDAILLLLRAGLAVTGLLPVLRPIAPPGEGRRDYLELRRGFFTGYVTCFAHGQDLYIGWTYWIRISPARVLLMRIGRKFQNYTGRGDDIFQTLRFESAQAGIAAIHTCLLEGVDAATGAPRGPDGEIAGLK
jgi:hypothetical protein